MRRARFCRPTVTEAAAECQVAGFGAGSTDDRPVTSEHAKLRRSRRWRWHCRRAAHTYSLDQGLRVRCPFTAAIVAGPSCPAPVPLALGGLPVLHEQTEVSPSYAHHQLTQLRAVGAELGISTDQRTITPLTLSREYARLA